MKIKSIIILLLTLTVLLGFTLGQKAKTIKGDLYFSFLRVGSFYGQPDSTINKVKTYFDSVNLKTLDEDDMVFLKQYEILKKENLLNNPFVQLLAKKSVINLYLDQSSYDKIKIYKRQELQDNKKKIVITAEVRKLGDGMFLCEKLILVDKIDGQTLNFQEKFKIEDYN